MNQKKEEQICFPLPFFTLTGGTPVPEPPNIQFQGPPPKEAYSGPAMWLVPDPAWAIRNATFLGPQPIPPDHPSQVINEYLLTLKNWAAEYDKAVDQALLSLDKRKRRSDI